MLCLTALVEASYNAQPSILYYCSLEIYLISSRDSPLVFMRSTLCTFFLHVCLCVHAVCFCYTASYMSHLISCSVMYSIRLSLLVVILVEAGLQLLIRWKIFHLIGLWELSSCKPQLTWMRSTLTGLPLLSARTRPRSSH